MALVHRIEVECRDWLCMPEINPSHFRDIDLPLSNGEDVVRGWLEKGTTWQARAIHAERRLQAAYARMRQYNEREAESRQQLDDLRKKLADLETKVK